MKHRAETLGGGWQRMWDEGVGDTIHRRQTWLESNAPTLRAALTSPLGATGGGRRGGSKL
jgi:hypothetical protein